MAHVDTFVAEARRFIGQPYVWAAEIPTRADPTGVGPVDCSELTSVAARRAGIGASVPDGAYAQMKAIEDAGLLTSAAEARKHYGWLLFYDNRSTATGRNRVVHVAISLGDGTTLEAWHEGVPVGCYDATRSRFTTGGPIPGLDYGTTPPPQPEPPPTGGGSTTHTTLPVDGGGKVTVRILKKGLSGRDVREVQVMLTDWGFPLSNDGQFGSKTDSAVRSFQAARALTVDGIVGQRTWSSVLGY